jgi:hypothetical protein
MRILVVTDKRLASLSDGYDLRVWDLRRELAKRHEMYPLTVPLGLPRRFNDSPIGLGDVFKNINDIYARPLAEKALPSK